MDPESAAEHLVEKIFAGAYPPGGRLTERDIAELCGCSHAVARKVIHVLQAIGAIRFSSRRGALVIGPGDLNAGEVGRVWERLLPLLEADAGRAFSPPSAGQHAYARLQAARAELDRMGLEAGEPRLAELLKKVSLQGMILQLAA